MKTLFKGNVVQKDKVIPQGIVVVEGARIVFVGEEHRYSRTGDEAVFHYPDSWICPGLIDFHIHGNAGHDVMDATFEALEAISKSLCRYGVTGFLPTTMTAPLHKIYRVVQNIVHFTETANEYAQILGIHLEGPWINKKYKGAQKEEDIMEPSLEQAEKLLEIAGDQLRVVTIAPEIFGALPVISNLSQRGVICSIGHTDATLEQVNQACECGASHFTHLYNAMRGLHHREIGVVGAALTKKDMTCDIIADFIHSHPNAVELAYQVKGREKLLLISDGIEAVGMEDGVYELGGQTVYVNKCIARLEDGTLAGSTLTLNRAIRNLVEQLQIPITDAVYMAATAPAEKLGLAEKKGSLEVGKDADVVVFSHVFDAQLTMINGKVVYREE
ncbi:N-acetylglucosamine-6-phosphate deacetylase [Thermoflavimicrobium dichotomicum]|uniref:N-acetylglucosamine-6-phosphate deacetylase n=1 Tax=Thermoflavimicrobium dichotomicum TaxID=46223 RepID=A0A1I3P2M1_9BACL|nr:N-acetylglucosamine-6-phosphate deacetylase [Thermoflavimicrobium dichotomicum]SFJ15642.1 N-acetylglucosamine-6-phosphate deacetylase [Thermoflavimicrobium dichotomicum]